MQKSNYILADKNETISCKGDTPCIFLKMQSEI